MNKKGFFAKLFDFSFKSFVSIELAKIIYILAIIASLIILIFSLQFGSFYSFIRGLITVVFLILVARLNLEIMVVVFRMAENVQRLVNFSAPAETGTPPPIPEKPKQEEAKETKEEV